MRGLLLTPRRWPLAVRVPLLVSVLVLAAVLTVSKVLLDKLDREQTVQLAALSNAYLDGLTSALMPAVIRKDIWEAFDALDRARSLYGGVDTDWVAVVLPDRTVLAASDPELFPVGRHLPPEIDAHRTGPTLTIDGSSETAWLSRPLRQDDADVGWLLAKIDISAELAVWHDAVWTLIGIGFGLAVAFAVCGWLLVSRMLRPVGILARHIAATTELPSPIPAEDLRHFGAEFKALSARFNVMVEALREREALLVQLAEEERLALLGKLASGMAHEVNNPLGGMLTAVDTIATHGGAASVRQQAVEFLRRGLNDIRNVVRASLVLYKEQVPQTSLLPEALDDLRHLAAPEAHRRQVTLEWANVLSHPLQTDGTAARQIVLNLLLNAVAASPPCGCVSVRARFADGLLTIEISDEGPGLPPPVADAIRSGTTQSAPPNIGLGVWTALFLARRGGGCIRQLPQAHGTCLALELPCEEVSDAALAA